MNVEQALFLGKNKLKKANIESYAIDAELLLMHIISFTKVQLYTKNDFMLTQAEEKEFFSALQQREQGKPVQYMIGKCEFMGLDFFVEEGVLIPRADTEILVEAVLEYAEKENLKRGLDICTGTGCIAVSMAKYGDFSLCGIDISDIAIETAKKNACRNHVSITWIKSDLFTQVPQNWKNNLDMIVSNPPYIATKAIENLMTSVKCFEPHLALDGGENGTLFYEKIITEGKNYLKQGGWFFFEIGYDQGETVSELLQKNGFDNIEIRKDLAGLDRVVLGKKKCV